MCLLTYFPGNTQPDLKALREGGRTNRDGFGYAIVIPSEGRILVQKSMILDDILGMFTRDRKRYPEGPALFHHRLTTDGVTGTYNCHPFNVNSDPRTVLAHNGIFAQARPVKGDIRSDTRIVADSFARKFRLRTAKGRKRFASWMGDYNKVVILTVDPSYDSYAYIINEDRGIWDQGIWYSNSSYVPWVPRVSSYVGYGLGYSSECGTWYKSDLGVWKWRENKQSGTKKWLDCPVCEKAFCVNPQLYRCVLCKSCQMCYESEADCLCWLETPATEVGKPTRNERDLDALISEYEEKEARFIEERHEISKALVPLGRTVSDALDQVHRQARESHSMACDCYWCVTPDPDAID